MHLHHDCKVVKERGDDSRNGDLYIRDAEELRHDEGPRAHDEQSPENRTAL